MSERPTVVIVGRPNVGKSSLVNRIVGRRVAVVEEHPGVTRDRKAVEAEWTGVTFDLVDTGGWLAGGDALDDKVSEQAERRSSRPTWSCCVVDATVGVTDEDLAVARIVKRTGRPVLLVANKVDDEPPRGGHLGVHVAGPRRAHPGERPARSGRRRPARRRRRRSARAERRRGRGRADEDGDPTTRVAIVGRPNVGKSTLFNQLIGEDRSVVHDMPGTTRDAIDTVVETDDGPIRFIDTAGMRRRAQTERGARALGAPSLDALDRADIALLVIDATVGATHQDQRLAEARMNGFGCGKVRCCILQGS